MVWHWKQEGGLKGLKTINNPIDNQVSNDLIIVITISQLKQSFKFIKKSLKKAQCLKITEKVSFNIASVASYVYILSGQKFTKNGPICASFWKPEACGQTVLPDRSISIGQKLVKKTKIQMRHFEWFLNDLGFSSFTDFLAVSKMLSKCNLVLRVGPKQLVKHQIWRV